MGCHVSAVPNGITQRNISLTYRAHVAMMCGSFGFELNPSELTAKEKSGIPQIMADAAHAVFTLPARECTGNFFIDEDLLDGDLGRYRYGDAAEEDLAPDLFL